MSLDSTLKTMDLEMGNSLHQFTKRKLANLLIGLIHTKDKETIVQIINDSTYFSLEDLLTFLEKKDKRLLFNILNEPKNAEELLQPIADWLKRSDFFYDYRVRLPKTRRRIDVVGCKFKKYLGLVGENAIIAVEIKTEPKIKAIDSAFAQAKEYLDCSDWAYVAVSPYVFLKNSEALLNRVNDFKNEVGLLLVNKLKVISIVEEAELTQYEDGKYRMIIDYFKSRS